MKKLIPFAILAVVTSTAACTEEAGDEGLPVSKAEAPLTAVANLETNIVVLADRLATIEDHKDAQNLLSALSLKGIGVDEVHVVDCVDGEDCGGIPGQEPASVTEQRHADAREVANELRERVLVAANLESEDEYALEYRLKADKICDSDFLGDDDHGNEDENEDGEVSECRRILDQVPIRVRLTQPSEGDIDLQILVGESRFAPITIELHHSALGIRVDLAQGVSAVREILAVTDPGDELPDFQLSGVLSAGATVGAAVAITGRIESAIDFHMAHEGEEVDFRLEPSFFEVTMPDAATGVTSLRAELGRLAASHPASFLSSGSRMCAGGEGEEFDCEDVGPEVNGTAVWAFNGLSGALALDPSAGSLRVVDFRFVDGGPSLTVDGQTALGVDLVTPANNLTLTMTGGDDDALNIAYDQVFEYTLQARASLLGGDADAGKDGTYRLAVEGAARPAMRFFENDAGETTLEMVAGRLVMSGPGEEVVVEAGECASEPEQGGDASDDRESDDVFEEVSDTANSPAELVIVACTAE